MGCSVEGEVVRKKLSPNASERMPYPIICSQHPVHPSSAPPNCTPPPTMAATSPMKARTFSNTISSMDTPVGGSGDANDTSKDVEPFICRVLVDDDAEHETVQRVRGQRCNARNRMRTWGDLKYHLIRAHGLDDEKCERWLAVAKGLDEAKKVWRAPPTKAPRPTKKAKVKVKEKSQKQKHDEALETLFMETQLPTREQPEPISRETGMQDYKVLKWFAKKREALEELESGGARNDGHEPKEDSCRGRRGECPTT
ncbi:uncharacterized protein EV422DRAFT_381458 [Fimicolochytrium jonesii]|uniref:uncharacterized protein n=1 Tax=Fimicolochytrium jonesii TaxID=1396493 RepID=UPI0022FDBE36|nr:uncharacterized protein EV422DRAFT_381458 [Fimicolochytrium jonesii]KAI8822858.1 hypothetical protein EV422DRAFT_381458 [Fimicolochytrium jonesii]